MTKPKPLDLANLLQHAFLSGVVAARNIPAHDECIGVELWRDYDPYMKNGAYERVTRALYGETATENGRKEFLNGLYGKLAPGFHSGGIMPPGERGLRPGEIPVQLSRRPIPNAARVSYSDPTDPITPETEPDLLHTLAAAGTRCKDLYDQYGVDLTWTITHVGLRLIGRRGEVKLNYIVGWASLGSMHPQRVPQYLESVEARISEDLRQ